MSLYDDIGGPGAVTATVAGMYARVWADPTLEPYFAGVDRRALQRHQRAFLQVAFGGAASWAGRPLDEAHAGLSITDAAFDRLVVHLRDTLEELEVGAPEIAAVAERVEGLRASVVIP